MAVTQNVIGMCKVILPSMINYILYRNRIVPNELQIETLHKICAVSQGIVSYQLRETFSIW